MSFDVLQISKKKQKIVGLFPSPYFCLVKTITTMVQAQLDGLLQFLLGSLDYNNRLWLSQHLIEPQTNEEVRPYTWEEINQHIDEAEADFAMGKQYDHQQIMNEMKQL